MSHILERLSRETEGMRPRKLTEQQVSAIRLAYSAGDTSMRTLGISFHVSTHTIWLIVNGRIWKHQAPIICPHCHHPVT